LSLIIPPTHEGGTSAFTFYEVEEALYKEIYRATAKEPNRGALRVAGSRPISIQALAATRLFD
jgi:hypothetical protein